MRVLPSISHTVCHASSTFLSYANFKDFQQLRQTTKSHHGDVSLYTWLGFRAADAIAEDAEQIVRSSDLPKVIKYCQDKLSTDDQSRLLAAFFIKAAELEDVTALRQVLEYEANLNSYPALQAMAQCFHKKKFEHIAVLLSHNSTKELAVSEVSKWLPSFALCGRTEIFRMLLDAATLDRYTLENCIMHAISTPYSELLELLLTHPSNQGRVMMSYEFMAGQAQSFRRTENVALIERLASRS